MSPTLPTPLDPVFHVSYVKMTQLAKHLRCEKLLTCIFYNSNLITFFYFIFLLYSLHHYIISRILGLRIELKN